MKLSILTSIIILNTAVYSQITANVSPGDSYETVVSKIEGDSPLNQFYRITKGKQLIRVSVMPGSGLNEDSIVEYRFKGKTLTRIYWINSNNPKGLLAFIFQNHTLTFGEPKTVKIDGRKAYHWPELKKNGKQYFYVGFSDWFQKEALFTVIQK